MEKSDLSNSTRTQGNERELHCRPAGGVDQSQLLYLGLGPHEMCPMRDTGTFGAFLSLTTFINHELTA